MRASSLATMSGAAHRLPPTAQFIMQQYTLQNLPILPTHKSICEPALAAGLALLTPLWEIFLPSHLRQAAAPAIANGVKTATNWVECSSRGTLVTARAQFGNPHITSVQNVVVHDTSRPHQWWILTRREKHPLAFPEECRLRAAPCPNVQSFPLPLIRGLRHS